MQGFAPQDTGNLAFNALKIEFPSTGVCEIYIDESIAPYMKYTEFPWISPKWNGKKNPNEGWFEHAAITIYLTLLEELNGMSDEDIDKMQKELLEWDEDYYKWQITKTR